MTIVRTRHHLPRHISCTPDEYESLHYGDESILLGPARLLEQRRSRREDPRGVLSRLGQSRMFCRNGLGLSSDQRGSLPGSTAQSLCGTGTNLRFSGHNADACLSAVKAAYADADLTAAEAKTVMRLGKPCDRLVSGPRNAGQSCDSSSDCNTPDGFECAIKGTSVDGTCQMPVVKQPGLSCAAAQEICTDGFYCNETNCVEGKALGEPCVNSLECGAEGYCSASSECTPLLTVGSQCTHDSECTSDVCYPSGGTTPECLERLRLSPSEPACDDLS